MTISNDNITAGPYNGNDIADSFSYGFGVTDSSQVLVYETDDLGVETILTDVTNYTVNNVGESAGGTITRVAGALPTGYQWYIRSNFDDTQETNFSSQGAFYPKIHERAFDKLTRLVQQLADKLTRSLRFSDGYSGTVDTTLPNPEEGKLLQYSTTGVLNKTIGEILQQSGAIEADLDVNGHKVSNMAPGTLDTDAVTLLQLIQAIEGSAGDVFGTAAFANVQTSPTDTTTGALMANGSWGWGGTLAPTLLNLDANDTNIAGTYRVASTDSNIPAGVVTGATMLVQAFDSSTPNQLIINVFGDGMWVRGKGGGGWQTWQPVYTGANVEYGSNANGEYLKFPNGVLHCWKKLTTAAPIDINIASSATGFRSSGPDQTLPHSFINTDYAVTAQSSGFGINAAQPSTVSTFAFGFSSIVSLTNQAPSYSWMAIGRWK